MATRRNLPKRRFAIGRVWRLRFSRKPRRLVRTDCLCFILDEVLASGCVLCSTPKFAADELLSAGLIVRDARDHDVEVRPVCVNASRWDCTLEPTDIEDRFAVRLGRGACGLTSPPRRGRCLSAGSETSPPRRSGRSRRCAMNRCRCLQPPLSVYSRACRRSTSLSSLSGRWRPVAKSSRLWPCRPDLAQPSNLIPARRSSSPPHRDLPGGHAGAGQTVARAAGLVPARQWPDSANGVMFLTMEDESGAANVVVWVKVFRGIPARAPLVFYAGRSRPHLTGRGGRASRGGRADCSLVRTGKRRKSRGAVSVAARPRRQGPSRQTGD